MSPKHKHHLTLAGLVSGITLLITSLGMLANGVVSLNSRLGAGVSATDSLFYNDSLLFARLARAERALKIRAGKERTPARPSQEQGLVRRIWRLIF
jgi:NAD/NADP transhydrogenase alpha subunit